LAVANWKISLYVNYVHFFLGLTFDWIQKKLYWCESNTGIIGRVSLLNSSEIFVDSEHNIYDITVDPYNRYKKYIP